MTSSCDEALSTRHCKICQKAPRGSSWAATLLFGNDPASHGVSYGVSDGVSQVSTRKKIFKVVEHGASIAQLHSFSL